jgi:hypothetical protein
MKTKRIVYNLFNNSWIPCKEILDNWRRMGLISI